MAVVSFFVSPARPIRAEPGTNVCGAPVDYVITNIHQGPIMITVVCIMLERFSASHTIVAMAGIEEERSISGSAPSEF